MVLSSPFPDVGSDCLVETHTGRSFDQSSWILIFSLGHNPPSRSKNSNLFGPALNQQGSSLPADPFLWLISKYMKC